MPFYTSRLALIHIKRHKIASILAGCFTAVSLLLFILANSNHEIISYSPNLAQTGLVTLVTGLGNFEASKERKKSGPGEGGKPVPLDQSKINLIESSFAEYGMNMVASESISLDRSIPDLRMEECRHWNYPTSLPKTSVIIVFHNEGWSALLRTVHSVINRSPAVILEEIVLVDDFSDKDHLKARLQGYIARFNGKVKLIRNEKREGLIRTRSRGAVVAKGEVIVFLDAHCEVGYNWLPPLLAPIKKNRTVMAVPVVDGIDHETWEYRSTYVPGVHHRGIFEWGMLYKENELPAKELAKLKHQTQPYKSPTHAGGLFAINRQYFLELGAYDPGLEIWGGENFELSFKIWQCGGSIEWVPCSHVGHVYKSYMAYGIGKKSAKSKGTVIARNYKRVVEVWMDPKYKEFFYTREPLARFIDPGDLSAQLHLKNTLKCKNFSWFMENVAYDVLDKFPELPPNLHWGEVRNLVNDKCLDTRGFAPPANLGLELCHGLGSNQLFRLNAKGQLGHGERCVDYENKRVMLLVCRLGTVDGPWIFDPVSRSLRHKRERKCLASRMKKDELILTDCRLKDRYQQWVFKEVRPTTSQ